MSDVAPDGFSHDDAASLRASAGQSLGRRLCAEREAKGWSVEYVASQLNLAVRQIQALEDENYAALPGIASVRGFVRAYAKLLRVDADALVGLIASEQIAPNQPLEPKPNLSSAPFSHSRLSGGTGRGNSLLGAAFALIVVLLAAGAIAIEHMGGWPTLSQSLTTQFKDLSGNGAAGSSAPADGRDSAPETLPAKPDSSDVATKDDNAPAVHEEREVAKEVTKPVEAAPAAVLPAPAASAPAPNSVAAAPAKNETPASVGAPKAAVASASGNGVLVLTARQNSWIDVRAGSNVIASHLLKAGDTENIDVPGAAQLTIGNAAGVDATFRGQSLPTKGDGKSNVAHINLK